MTIATEDRNEIGNIFARIHESEIEWKKVKVELAGQYAELAKVFQSKVPVWLWNTLLKIPHREIPDMFEGKNSFLKNLLYHAQTKTKIVINFGVWVDTTPIGKEFTIQRGHEIPESLNKDANAFFQNFKFSACFSKDKDDYLCLTIN